MFQLLFLIGWLGIFILSALGILSNFITDGVISNIGVLKLPLAIEQFIIEKYNIIILGVSIFYMLLAIKKFLSIFKGKESKTYTFESERGLISINYTAIESIIKKIIDNEGYVIGKKIKIKEKRKKLLLYIKLECSEIEGITGKIAKLQEKTANELENITAIKSDKINIRVSKIVKSEDEIISTEGE